MTFRGRIKAVAGLVVGFAGLLAGCGADSPSPSTGGGSCPSEIASLTPAQISMYSGAQIAALSTNIRCLSDAALGASLGTARGATVTSMPSPASRSRY
jgi:hypothetical protein